MPFILTFDEAALLQQFVEQMIQERSDSVEVWHSLPITPSDVRYADPCPSTTPVTTNASHFYIGDDFYNELTPKALKLPEIPDFPFSADLAPSASLVDRVRDFQKRSRHRSQQWRRFIKAKGLFSFDVSRHSQALLAECLQQHAPAGHSGPPSCSRPLHSRAPVALSGPGSCREFLHSHAPVGQSGPTSNSTPPHSDAPVGQSGPGTCSEPFHSLAPVGQSGPTSKSKPPHSDVPVGQSGPATRNEPLHSHAPVGQSGPGTRSEPLHCHAPVGQSGPGNVTCIEPLHSDTPVGQSGPGTCIEPLHKQAPVGQSGPGVPCSFPIALELLRGFVAPCSFLRKGFCHDGHLCRESHLLSTRAEEIHSEIDRIHGCSAGHFQLCRRMGGGSICVRTVRRPEFNFYLKPSDTELHPTCEQPSEQLCTSSHSATGRAPV